MYQINDYLLLLAVPFALPDGSKNETIFLNINTVMDTDSLMFSCIRVSPFYAMQYQLMYICIVLRVINTCTSRIGSSFSSLLGCIAALSISSICLCLSRNSDVWFTSLIYNCSSLILCYTKWEFVNVHF